MNTLIALIVALVIIGVVLWAVKAVPWIDDSIKKIINIVTIVVVLLWLLSVFFGSGSVDLPRLNIK